MIQIENREVFSTEGKYVHRIGTDAYFKRGTVIAADTTDNFEEVDELPAYSKAEYDAMVDRLVRDRYSASEEFAIQRKAINATRQPDQADSDQALDEYQAYNSYVEQCKLQAQDPALYQQQ